ncbi:VCBS repeat-containing protein [candidate division KSB1 bacterium]|nr:VCBS repeat-containing protein [candidate division KSB1 bacterium]
MHTEEIVTEWCRAYAFAGAALGKSVAKSQEGHLVLCGYYETGHNMEEAFVLETDATGASVKPAKIYSSMFMHRANCVIKTRDNGFLITGTTTGQVETHDLWITKLDHNLNEVWQNSYYTYDVSSEGLTIIQPENSDYLVCGYNDISSYLHHTETNAFLFKEGKFIGKYDRENIYSMAYDVVQVNDGYIFCGFIEYPNSTDRDIYVAKTNTSGQILWEWRRDGGDVDRTVDDYVYAITTTSDGNVVVCGTKWGIIEDLPHRFMAKLTTNGETVWEHMNYGDSGYRAAYHDIKNTSDGYLITCGKMSDHCFIEKLNTHGQSIWQKELPYHNLETIIEVSPGSYIACGTNHDKAIMLKVSEPQDVYPPVLLDPVSNKAGTDVNVWLDWNEVYNATSYTIQVDDNTSFSSPDFSQTLTDTRVLAMGLKHTTTYYWRVRAHGATSSDWSTCRLFTTMQPQNIHIIKPFHYTLGFLNVGDQYYTDRDFTITDIPQDLKGLLWIKTANEDQYSTSSSLIEYRLDQSARIYVAYDSRATSVPTWLSSQFNQTAYRIQVTDKASPLIVWQKDDTPGTFVLGGNQANGDNGAKSNYVLLVKFLDFMFTKVTTGSVVTETAASRGVACIDVNADSFPDIFVSNDKQNFLYINNGNGTFDKISTGQIVTNEYPAYTSTWGDYDNDGYLDVFIANRFSNKPELYRNNNGNGTFAKITTGAIAITYGDYHGACWGDYNNDGYIDLFAARFGSPNFLYKNNRGDGTFTKITTGHIVTQSASSHSASWCDYDNDGFLDLFVLNGGNNFLYHNNGDETFSLVSQGDIATDSDYSIGCSWGDYDGDGWIDVYVTNYGSNNCLYKNYGPTTGFKKMLWNSSIVNDVDKSESSAWVDYDNDGFLDLYVANENQQNKLYVQRSDGFYSHFDELITGDTDPTFGCAWADLDRNGFPDLLLANTSGTNDLYMNAGNNNNWLSVTCIGTQSNKAAIGARIGVKAVINGYSRWQWRQISSQTGGYGENSLVATFGLSDAIRVDSLRIDWPSGCQTIRTNVATNQLLSITEVLNAQWSVPITIINSGSQFIRTFGGDARATDGFDDGIDIPAPPPGQGFYAYFAIPQFPSYLERDIRTWASPFETVLEWSLVLQNTGDQSTTLRWDGTQVPPEGTFTLVADTPVDMRKQSEYTITADHICTIRYSKEQTYVYVFTQPGWHMISLPLIPSDATVSHLFPSALGGVAYAWDAATQAYQTVTQLTVGMGYWIAIPAATSDTVRGQPVFSYTLSLQQGWHLLGSVYGGADFSSPFDDPDGSVYTPAYGWSVPNGPYYNATFLHAGESYWVAAFNPCELTVGSPSSTALSSLERQTTTGDAAHFFSVFGEAPPLPPTETAIQSAPSLPDSFILLQNYPNPFNPETVIRFEVPEAVHVSIDIYDVQGKKIRSLLDEHTSAGKHQLLWDGLSDTGEAVPSGVYFVRMTSPAGSFTIKASLIK